MAQPLYYLPGVQREAVVGSDPTKPAINRQLLHERGLAGTFADVVSVGAVDVAKGPDGLSGCIIHYARFDGRIPPWTGYKPDAQAWSKCSAGAWIGLTNGQEPTEEDLRRLRQYAGYFTEMADQSWKIPIIRRVDNTTELPREMYWNEAGVIVEPIKEAYRHWWEESADVCSWFFQGAKEGYSKARGLDLAVQAVGINYRYGRFEQNACRIVDSESHLAILAASVDVPGFQDLEEGQKKS